MKLYLPQFSRFHYYENLQVSPLFDTMLNGKNVTECLWKILDGRNNKEKIVKVISGIEEAKVMQNLTHSYSDGQLTNIPWLLIEKESDVVKEVMQKIKFPIYFSSNINNI
jgi:hypothetical protein